MSAVRVLLVDDHEIVRAGVRVALEDHGGVAVVGEASSVPVAAELIEQRRPDVVIVDIDMREGSAIGLCRELSRRRGGTRVLVLTSQDNWNAVVEALQAGVDGYLLKRVSSSALRGAVDRVANGHSVIDPALTRLVVEWMAHPEPQHPQAGADLTDQQRAIMGLVAEGLSNKEIGERLYLAEKTVKNHLTRIMARLGVKSRTRAALMAWQASDQPATGPVSRKPER